MGVEGWVCLGLVAAVFGLFALLVLAYFYLIHREKKQREDYLANATPLVGRIVQANTVLYSPDLSDNVAQVLIATDGTPGEIDQTIGDLALQLASLKGTDPADPTMAALARLVDDEAYRPFERFPLSREFTGGRRVYSCHIWVERKRLVGKMLKHPFIRCLVFTDEPKSRLLMDDYKPEDKAHVRRKKRSANPPDGEHLELDDEAQTDRQSASARIRCPFCHDFIEQADYPSHEAEHRKTRPDGQQSDYATLPESERDQGELESVPQVYKHRRCGTATRMPEEIVRSYLKNPHLYMADETFCTGCGRHVPFRECTWTETGENLQTYMDKLRAEKPRRT